jgi:hypothetical protein
MHRILSHMARYPGVELLAAISLCVALPLPSAAQGGWRSWDLYLRDGTRIEANPLGAPDDVHLAISVGGMERHDKTIARARIALVAAQTTVGPRRERLAGDTLPPRPTGRACEDVIVLRNGRKTTGHVSLTRVQYSEGVVTQGGVEMGLDSIAYIKFADSPTTACKSKKRASARSHEKRP